MVVDEEDDLPHAFRKEAKNSPSLVLFPASIGEHVYPRRPAVVSGGGSGFAPVTTQVVVRDPDEAVEVKIAMIQVSVTFGVLDTRRHLSVSTIAPPHASDGFKTDSAPFLSDSFFFLMVRPVHVDVNANKCKSITHFVFNLAACSGEYSLFPGLCSRRLRGGAIVEILISFEVRGPVLMLTVDKRRD